MSKLTVFWDTTEAELQFRESNVWTAVPGGGSGTPAVVYVNANNQISVSDLDDNYWPAPTVTNVTNNTTNTTQQNLYVLTDIPDEEPRQVEEQSGIKVVSDDTRVNYPAWPMTLTENVVMPFNRSAVMHGPLDTATYTLDLTTSTLATL